MAALKNECHMSSRKDSPDRYYFIGARYLTTKDMSSLYLVGRFPGEKQPRQTQYKGKVVNKDFILSGWKKSSPGR
jgi:hypothetical protein